MKKSVMFLLIGIFFLIHIYLAGAVVNVTECGTIGIVGETYELNKSIGSGAGSDCLVIANNSVTLDCNGYTITFGNATAGAGVYVFNESDSTGFSNITIKNCIITQNTTGLGEGGIYFGSNSTNITLFKNTITTINNASYGITFEDYSLNLNISFNTVNTTANNSVGISVGEGGSIANVTSNTVITYGTDSSGIKMGDESSGLVYNNTITASGEWSLTHAMAGVWLESNTAGINVSNNTITMSGYGIAGIWIWSCYNHTIERNTITSTGLAGDGMFLSDLEGVSILSNTINITGNYGEGIYSYISPTTITFRKNIITTSGAYSTGISLVQDSYSNLSSNNITTSGASSHAIFSNQSHNNTIASNRITTRHSTSYLIYLTTSGNQTVYDNFLNSSVTGSSGIYIINSNLNYFNTTSGSSTNIIGKTSFGGNFWTNANGDGYSDYCVNLGSDYYCDSSYRVVAGVDSFDYLPLTNYLSNLSACGNLNTKKRYILNTSLSSNGTCFNITTNKVFLDLNGHTITGGTIGYGVNITGYNSTRVFNGFIQNFSKGIYASSAFYSNLTSNTVSSTENNSTAIEIVESDNSTIYSNTITTSGNWSAGISVDSSPNCNITNNNLTLTGYGTSSDGVGSAIYIQNSAHYFLIYNNTVNTTKFETWGIYMNFCSYGNFSKNTITTYGDGAHGFYLVNSSNNNSIFLNTITTNDILGTGAYAFSLGSSVWNNVSFNNLTTKTNTSYAVYVYNQANYTFIHGNLLLAEGYVDASLYLNGGTGNMTGCIVTGNDIRATDSDVGIPIATAKATGNLIYNNILNCSLPWTNSPIAWNSQHYSVDNLTNTWNTAKKTGTSIVGGVSIGGNYWTTPEGDGYSDTCTDAGGDNICDTAYTSTDNNIDYYPLTLNPYSAGGDDSSASSGSTPTFSPTEEQLAEGYTKVLYTAWRISFKIEDESHEFIVKSINETNVKVRVSSDVQEAMLSSGEEKKFELSGDDYYDLKVKLNSIDSNKASFTLWTIHDLESENGEEESLGKKIETIFTKNSSLKWILLAVIVILIGILLSRGKSIKRFSRKR